MLTDIAQLLLNGVMAGAILTAPAIGLTAIYAVLRFPNFAVASHATIGAFAGYCANVWLGLQHRTRNSLCFPVLYARLEFRLDPIQQVNSPSARLFGLIFQDNAKPFDFSLQFHLALLFPYTGVVIRMHPGPARSRSYRLGRCMHFVFRVAFLPTPMPV